MNIGIVGNGFVGSSVAFGFSSQTGCDGAEVRIHDKDPAKSLHSLEETVHESDFIFLSVPTPSNKDGSINLDILSQCLGEINHIASQTDSYNSVYLIRSTVVPGTTRSFQEQFPKLKLVFNPEFLTERSANFDFISQSRFILGGPEGNAKVVSDLYKDRFGNSVSVIITDYESAELTKYVCNTFFATKVSFLNEMRILSDKVNANWDDVMEGFLRDGRIGNSHSQVPGPDGKFGFGGSCFPKDIQALIHFADGLEIDLSVLKGAWKTNIKVRPERDWEELVGRAVVKDG